MNPSLLVFLVCLASLCRAFIGVSRGRHATRVMVEPDIMTQIEPMNMVEAGELSGIVDDLSADFTAPIFSHLGDYEQMESLDVLGAREKADYEMNVGRALEVLRRQLPYIFAINNLDFSIFAQQIMLTDEKQNRFMMQKNLYTAAVRSLRVASAISMSLSPSMNVRKIQYIEEDMTIECLVDVVLPDAIRVDGQSMWEGMFFFGLNSQGKICSHTFDRKIETRTPQRMLNTASYPWIAGTPTQPQIDIPVPVFRLSDE